MGKRVADMTPEEHEKQLEYHRKWRIKNKDKCKQYAKKYIENNREKRRATAKKWLDKNPEKRDIYNARRREDRKKRPEHYKEQEKRRREKHREALLKRSREYAELHRDDLKEWQKKYREENKDLLKQKRHGRVLYLSYVNKLTPDEDPMCGKDGFLMVRDFHTKEYFYPTVNQVKARVRALNGTGSGECHLYASEESKLSCSVYGFNPNNDPTKKDISEIDPFWRKTVIERANGHCERCGKASDVLHAHHIIPKGVCGMLEEDFDNGIALCPECHLGEGGVHDMDGCRLHELAAEKREIA